VTRTVTQYEIPFTPGTVGGGVVVPEATVTFCFPLFPPAVKPFCWAYRHAILISSVVGLGMVVGHAAAFWQVTLLPHAMVAFRVQLF
jgi:hypothetical protein